MSLQAWYPFNGNLENLGLGDLDLHPIFTPSYNTFGKVTEQCLGRGQFGWSGEQSKKVLNNKALSFCFWIKPNSSNGSGLLFGQNQSELANRRFCIFTYPTNNDLHLDWKNNSGQILISETVWYGVFSSDVWTHCVITYEYPNVVKIYINGRLYSAPAPTGNINDVIDYNTVTEFFVAFENKNINDFRIYDHCLSPKEVKEISKGLMLHYPLNNNGLGCKNLLVDNFNAITTLDTITEYDVSGYKNNGIRIGTLDYEPDSPRYSASSYFNGTDAYIKIPKMTLDFNNVTFSTWYKPSGNVEGGRIFDFGVGINGSGTTFLIDQNQQKMELCIQGTYPGGTNIHSSDDVFYPIVANTWYHVACSIEGTICKWYMDGKLVMTKILTQNIGVVTFINNFLAKSNWTVNPLNRCNICDFRIYATCLSEEDIKELYNKPISIDNQGTLFVTELNEENTNSVKFGKNGIVDIESINPNENISNKFKIYKNYIECSDIIEN